MSGTMQRMAADSLAYTGSACAPPSVLASRRRITLAQAIESQIVPRLVVRRAAAGIITPEEAQPSIMSLPKDAMDLADLAMAGNEPAVRQRVQEACSRQTLEAVCLELLTPAARYLGAMWEEDLCSFTDVTLGMMGLQGCLHDLSADAGSGHADGFRRHRIALVQPE